MPYNWQTKMKRVAKMPLGIVPQTAVVAAPVPSLPDEPMRLKRDELVEIANAHGLAVEDDWSKRQIIEALNG